MRIFVWLCPSFCAFAFAFPLFALPSFHLSTFLPSVLASYFLLLLLFTIFLDFYDFLMILTASHSFRHVCCRHASLAQHCHCACCLFVSLSLSLFSFCPFAFVLATIFPIFFDFSFTFRQFLGSVRFNLVWPQLSSEVSEK